LDFQVKDVIEVENNTWTRGRGLLNNMYALWPMIECSKK